jgi:hypothetical protein
MTEEDGQLKPSSLPAYGTLAACVKCGLRRDFVGNYDSFIVAYQRNYGDPACWPLRGCLIVRCRRCGFCVAEATVEETMAAGREAEIEAILKPITTALV